jgi:hypothetical protein
VGLIGSQLNLVVFWMKHALSISQAYKAGRHQWDCDNKSEEEIDKDGVVPRAGIEEDIYEGSEDKDNQRDTTC